MLQQKSCGFAGSMSAAAAPVAAGLCHCQEVFLATRVAFFSSLAQSRPGGASCVVQFSGMPSQRQLRPRQPLWRLCPSMLAWNLAAMLLNLWMCGPRRVAGRYVAGRFRHGSLPYTPTTYTVVQTGTLRM